LLLATKGESWHSIDYEIQLLILIVTTTL